MLGGLHGAAQRVAQGIQEQDAMLPTLTSKADEASFRELYRMTERLTVGVENLKEQFKELSNKIDREKISPVEYAMLKRITLINSVAIIIILLCLGGVITYLLLGS